MKKKKKKEKEGISWKIRTTRKHTCKKKLEEYENFETTGYIGLQEKQRKTANNSLNELEQVKRKRMIKVKIY